MVKTKPTILLNEAFPDAFNGKGIFSEMPDMPWSDSEIIDSSLLDMDYFGNHSGDKKCSPLLYRLMESDYTISDSNREKIAALVVARFLPNWQSLWNTYHLEYNPITDYSMNEVGENEEESSGNQSSTKSGTNTGTDNLSKIHGEKIETDNEISTEAHNFKFGFNSSDHVPTEDAVGHNIENREESHSGTDSDNRTLNLANSESQSGTESGSKSGSYSKTRTGVTGAHTIQELIRAERELWIEDYFERVFSDIDSVVASMIYVRENRSRYYPWFPLCY